MPQRTASTQRRSILLIDDDVQNLAVLTDFLSSRYEVRTSSDPRTGVEMALRDPPSLIVCDVDMPGMNGFEVCEAIRAGLPSSASAQLPIVFLTSDAQAESMQRGLAAGGSDYLLKPFRLQELLKRVELRLGLAPMEAPIQVGNLSLDPAQRLAVVDVRGKKRQVWLTERGFRVLAALLRNEGRLLSRQQLLNEAWGASGGDGEDGGLSEEGTSDRAVDLHVFRLRKQLSGWSHEIQSVYGRGYSVGQRPGGARKRRV